MANLSSTNPELYQKLLMDANFAAYETSVSRAVMTAFSMPMGTGKTVSVPRWAAMTASKPNENVAPAASDTTTSSADITIGRHVVYHQVSDLLSESSESNIISDVGMQSGMAVGESIDEEAFALFYDAGITQEVGTEDSVTTLDHLLDAATIIRKNKYRGVLNAVLSPGQVTALRKELATAGGAGLIASPVGGVVQATGFLGAFGGINIYESGLVDQTLNTDADADLNARGCVFAPGAFGQVMRGGVRIRDMENIVEGNTDLVVEAYAGAGILHAPFAVRVIGKA